MSEDEKEPEGWRGVWKAVSELGAAVTNLREVTEAGGPADHMLAVIGAKAIVPHILAFIHQADGAYQPPDPPDDVWPNEHPHYQVGDPVAQEESYRRVLRAFRFKGGRIPEHMHDTVVDYLVHHRPAYDEFFDAILENDLRVAVGKADSDNIVNLHAWVAFFHNFASSEAWGSGERVQAWLQAGRPGGFPVGAPVEAGDPVVIKDDGKAYPATAAVVERTPFVVHLFRAATAVAICGNRETIVGVSCYPADFPDMVRKLNPEAVPCERCLEVSRT